MSHEIDDERARRLAALESELSRAKEKARRITSYNVCYTKLLRLDHKKSFLGLTLSAQRDVLLMLVEEHLSRHILEHIAEVGKFDDKPGAGIAIQIDVEDAVGVLRQAEVLTEVVEDAL